MDSSSPRWTIAIPTYNRSAVILQAIQSAIRAADELETETAADIEILVCDNASTDDTDAVVRSLNDQRIRLLTHDKTVSMYANHNRCIRAATGDWITFLHSDDVYPDGYLSKIAGILETQTDVDLITTIVNPKLDVNITEIANRTRGGDIADRRAAAAELVGMILCVGGATPSGTFFRRSMLDRAGPFHEDTLCADVDMFIRIALAGGRLVHFRHEPAVWQVSEHSCTSSIVELKRYWKDVKVPFRSAMTDPARNEIRRAMVNCFKTIPAGYKIESLHNVVAAGHRGLAARMFLGDPRRRRMMRRRSFYSYLLPTVLCNAPYHHFRWRWMQWRRARVV